MLAAKEEIGVHAPIIFRNSLKSDDLVMGAIHSTKTTSKNTETSCENLLKTPELIASRSCSLFQFSPGCGKCVPFLKIQTRIFGQTEGSHDKLQRTTKNSYHEFLLQLIFIFLSQFFNFVEGFTRRKLSWTFPRKFLFCYALFQKIRKFWLNRKHPTNSRIFVKNSNQPRNLCSDFLQHWNQLTVRS